METESRSDQEKQEISDDVRLFLTALVQPRDETNGASMVGPMTHDEYAVYTLDKYAPQIRWVAESVHESFKLDLDRLKDVYQEARILVLQYVGVLPGWNHGMLIKWQRKANGDDKRIRSLLAYELRINLSQIIGRMESRNPPGDSLTYMVDEQQFDIEDTESEVSMYNQEQANRLMRKYPELAMQAIEGMTIDQIIAATGKSRATVFRRIDGQKRSFLSDALRRSGLTVEGDESMEDLEEAYTNITKLRR